MKKLLLATAAVAALAGCGTAPARPVTPEQAFVSALDSAGIRYSSKDAAVDYAHQACTAHAAGTSSPELVATLQEQGGYSRADAATIVTSALAAFCGPK